MRHGLPTVGVRDESPRSEAGRGDAFSTRDGSRSLPSRTAGAGLAALVWLILALAGGREPLPGGDPAAPASEAASGWTLGTWTSSATHLESAPVRRHVPAARPVPPLPRRFALYGHAPGQVPVGSLGQDAPEAIPPRCDLSLVLAAGLRLPPPLDPPPLSPRAPTRAARAPPLRVV